MNDPEEHFLWALMNSPGINTSPLIMPEKMARQLSKHLHECGFRHDPAAQEKKLLRPFRGQQNNFNGMAKWVPMDEPEPDPVVLPDVNALTPQENEAMLAQYRANGALDREVQEILAAERKHFGAFVVGENGGGI